MEAACRGTGRRLRFCFGSGGWSTNIKNVSQKALVPSTIDHRNPHPKMPGKQADMVLWCLYCLELWVWPGETAAPCEPLKKVLMALVSGLISSATSSRGKVGSTVSWCFCCWKYDGYPLWVTNLLVQLSSVRLIWAHFSLKPICKEVSYTVGAPKSSISMISSIIYKPSILGDLCLRTPPQKKTYKEYTKI